MSLGFDVVDKYFYQLPWGKAEEEGVMPASIPRPTWREAAAGQWPQYYRNTVPGQLPRATSRGMFPGQLPKMPRPTRVPWERVQGPKPTRIPEEALNVHFHQYPLYLEPMYIPMKNWWIAGVGVLLWLWLKQKGHTL